MSESRTHKLGNVNTALSIEEARSAREGIKLIERKNRRGVTLEFLEA